MTGRGVQVSPGEHSSGSAERRRKAEGRGRKVRIYAGETRYPVVRQVSKQLGFALVVSAKSCNVYWHDFGGISMDALVKLDADQKVNHFPGMSRICQKCRLAAALQRYAVAFPKEFDFHPLTWSVPHGYKSLVKWFQEKPKRRKPWMIVKPDGGCQGDGIFLTNVLEDVPADGHKAVAVQQYIDRPLKVNGYKFDMRIYVLVTSVTPVLRAFIHKEGLARFCTSKYQQPAESNKAEQFMHLTNYSINKTNTNFRASAKGQENKWTLSRLFAHFQNQGINTKVLWSQCKDIVRKTLLSILPSLAHEYLACFGKSRSEGGFRCFEVLGFDIILDEKLKPWLLEVNHSPSLHCDTDLDTRVKSSVVKESLLLGAVTPQDLLSSERTGSKQASNAKEDSLTAASKVSAQANQLDSNVEQLIQELRTQYEDAHVSGFERIYPVSSTLDDESLRHNEIYNKIEQHKGTLLKESSSVQRRREHIRRARQKREQHEALERLKTKNRKPWGSSTQGKGADQLQTRVRKSHRADKPLPLDKLKLKIQSPKKTRSLTSGAFNSRKAFTPRRTSSARVRFIPPRKTLCFPET